LAQRKYGGTILPETKYIGHFAYPEVLREIGDMRSAYELLKSRAGDVEEVQEELIRLKTGIERMTQAFLDDLNGQPWDDDKMVSGAPW